ncbi:MAG: tyrosine-type recombinase/integrase, partial [Thermoplasmata archaeon]
GIRIGTALQLRLNDIHLNADHVQVTVRGGYEKEATSFLAFASGETKELLEEWLKVRDDYLTSAVNRSRAYGKDVDDDRVFPMHAMTAGTLWKKALADTGLGEKDPNTNWTILHPHTLRQRVRSRMAEAGVPSDIAEALIGHRTYLDQYKKWDTATMLKFYKQAEHLLVPSGVARTIQALDEKMEKENKDLQFQVDILTRELTRLTTENEDLKKDFNSIRAMADIRVAELKEALQKKVLQ